MQASMPRRRSRWHPLAATLGAVLLVALAAAVMLAWHGLGHTLAARGFGDATATWRWFHYSGTATCVGCSSYDPAQLGTAANAVVAAAGLLATQLVTLLVLPLLGRTGHAHPAARVGFALLAGACVVGDLCVALAQALRDGVPTDVSPSVPDLSRVARFLAEAWGLTGSTALVGIATVGAAVAVAELCWLGGAWQRAGRGGNAAYGGMQLSVARHGR